MYSERTYRSQMNPIGLVSYTVKDRETDLHVSTKINLQNEVKKYVQIYRRIIEEYIKKDENFESSLIPIDLNNEQPELVKHMVEASKLANVGPMACVAGAISQYVGNSIMKLSNEVIIENGGDLFINSDEDKKVLIFAGDSPFSNNIALKVSKENMPIGICTSAGTIGHSLSFGNADAVVVLSKDTLLADSVATSVGNIVKSIDDIEEGIDYGSSINGILGILIIIKDKMGVWGDIQVVDPNS